MKIWKILLPNIITMKFKPLYFNMNHSLRRLAIKNRFVLTLINEFYSLKNSYRFQQIIAENKNLTILITKIS